MKKLFKGLGLVLMALALVLGLGAGSASAAITLSATSMVADGALTLVFEGATADAFETTVAAVDPTADQTISLPNNGASSAFMTSALTTNAVDAANAVTGASNGLLFEGATADGFELTLTVGDPGADVTITLPASSAAAGIFLTSLTTNAVDVANSVTGTSNGFIAEGATADGFETTVSFADPGADFTLTIPASTAAAAPLLTALTTNAVDVANAVTGVSNGLLLEGATADAFEITISPVDPTADATWSIPNFAVNAAFVGSTLTTNNVDAANSVWGVSNGLVLEGATADAFEITISPVDPTADATWSIPNFAVNAAFVGSTLTTNNVDAANSVWGVSNGLVLEGATADAFETTVTLTDPTADRTITIPNLTGRVQLASACSVITAGATPTLTVGLSNCYTDTPTGNQDQTITFSGAGNAGEMLTIIFTAGAGDDEVITFQTTLVNSIGTLTVADNAGGTYAVTFLSDGSVWQEIARTAIAS